MSDVPESTLARGAAATATAAGRLGASLRAALSAYADFLARISWLRFFALAILGLIAVAILDNLLLSGKHSVKVTESELDEKIKLQLRVDPDGKIDVTATRVPRQNGAGRPAKADAKRSKDRASVRIDVDGVRIVEKDTSGESSVVLIDRDGVRVENRPAEGKDQRVPDPVVPPLPPDAASRATTQQIAAQIQDRIEQAINRELEAAIVKHTESGHEPHFLVPLYMVLFFASAIIKIVGGDRKQAVARAGAAEADAERETLRRQLLEARLQALQAQIEPHFLFNTLGSVEYLIETDTARAGAMLKSLILYLRAALPNMRSQTTTLGREAELVRAYLELLKFRMEERLNYRIDLPVGLASAEFPPMMLQSIVENAIKHGLEPKTDGGTISLSAAVADGGLHVTVADTGLGLGLSPIAGTGLGLANVRERLHALYGERGKLVIESNRSGGTLVRIEVPYAAAAQPKPRADGNAGQPVST